MGRNDGCVEVIEGWHRDCAINVTYWPLYGAVQRDALTDYTA